METLTYPEARNKIGDGDIVFIQGSDSFAGRFTQWYTNSQYYHAAITFWIHDSHYKPKLCCVEQHMGGQRIVNLSSYSMRTIDVIEAPADFTKYGDALIDNTGQVAYAYMNLISIGLREKFGIKWKEFTGSVCSEMVAEVLVNQEINIPTLVSPVSLFDTLVELGFNHKLRVVPPTVNS